MPISIVQTPRNLLGIANKFVSHPPMSNNSKVARLFQMDERTNLASLRVFRQPRKGKRTLELLEWMKKWWRSAVWNSQWPPKAEALDPATLEEARRRTDWPKWDLAIKAELEALKKAGTWGVVEGLRGGILLRANGYCTSRRMRPGGSNATRPDSLPKDSLKSTAWIIMKHSHLLQN